MKKYIKQISILSLFLTFASCTEDVELEMVEVGGNVVLTDRKISRLDTNNDIKSKVILKEGVTITKIEVYNNTAASTSAPIILGAKVGDATVNGEIATFSSSLLQDNPNFDSNQATASGTIRLAFVTTYSDGTTTTNPYVLTVARGINWRIINGDGDEVDNATSGITDIRYLDPTDTIIKYKVYKKYASTVVDEVTLQWKKNKAGTYANDAIATVDSDDDDLTVSGSINLGKTDYAAYGLAVNDTLYYKFTVKSGTQTDYIETAIAINTQEFAGSKTAHLSDVVTMSKFSFETGLNYANTNTADGEIVFTTPFGISKTGATAITFVKSNSTDFGTANLFTAEEDYEAGTAVTSLTGLTTDDVVIYKIVRDAVTYYGLIKVGDLTTTTTINNETNNSFAIEYKEGTILRNN